MKMSSPLGTNFGIRREVMSILRRTLGSPKSGLADEIVSGRGNGAFMVAAWMMFHVSPNISGNYYVFDYAGDFPRTEREGGVKGFSRKALANRRDWARDRAIDALDSKIKFEMEDAGKFKSGETRTVPVNSSKDTKLRPWDIPLIALEKQMLIPTHWIEYGVQFHAEETYRLNANFVQAELPMLLGHGKLLRNVFLGHTELNKYLREPVAVWGRLKEVLLHQHKETRWKYEDNLEKLDAAMQKSFGEEAKVAFLAFSIAEFRPKYHL